jgi:prepilin-type N-terminal cleavage/methylation domain-containing protein
MEKSKGLTLAELIIALVISAVILLTIGVISQVGPGSYHKLESESGLYSDIIYGFDLMKNKARAARAVTIEAPRRNWRSDKLILTDVTGNSSAFGLYQPARSQNIDFVYLRDSTDETNRDVIFSNPDPIGNPVTLILTPDAAGEYIDVRLSGTITNESFNLTSGIYMRNS